MPKDPVCGNEINLEDVRSQSGQTSAGASEVDPSKGTRASSEQAMLMRSTFARMSSGK